MHRNQILFPQELYDKHLSLIQNVHFTRREIDVIACLLNARGTSKIALLLSIDPRTVETHIRNIMFKLERNSREDIIDFVEASDKHLLLRKYYSLLRINLLFEKSLKDLSKLNYENKLTCYLINSKAKTPLFNLLKSHMELVGINVAKAAKKKERNFVTCILSHALTKEELIGILKKSGQNSKKTVILLQEKTNQIGTLEKIKGIEIIDFTKNENYYFSFFTLLQKIIPNLKLDESISDFKDKYKKLHPIYETSPPTDPNKTSRNQDKYKLKGKIQPILWLSSGIVFIGLLLFYWNQRPETPSFRSDLVIPSNSVLLHRPDLINQINDNFKKQGGIQTVALVGPGGAGKTTLARQFADHQKDSVIWEANAETIESLRSSFEKLAKLLAKNEYDHKVLKSIQDIKDAEEREKQIIPFVKEHLKASSSWFLILDNVERFLDIKKYFPQDSQTWGNGKVIITTRNSNILHNSYLDCSVYVEELSPSEKLSLFSQIMTHGGTSSQSMHQLQDSIEFLENIPPFPLDISIAAYYLKATGVSHKTYLDNLFQNKKEFEIIQENLLKESGEYIKTRSGIITLALQHIINAHDDFKDLLLLICLLDSQNIHRDLLETYKKSVVVDNFIHHLKKYSLIIDNSPGSASTSLSMHRSTQAISFTYLVKQLDLYHDIKRMNFISYLLSDYVGKIIDQEDFYKIEAFLNHCKFFMKHSDILSDHAKVLVSVKLAGLYFYRGDYPSAESLLKRVFLILGDDDHKNFNELGEANHLLGMIYRETGKHQFSKEYLEKSLSIYRKYNSKNYAEVAKVLGNLGYLYRDLGDFKRARNLLDDSIKMYKTYASKNSLKIAHLLVFQGVVYRELGEYEKARKILEESLSLCNTKLPKDHFMRVWPLVFLGSVYRELGFYEEGRILIEKGLEICQKWLPKNHINLAGTFVYLADVYNQLGKYHEAKELIESGLAIYVEQVPDHPIYLAWASSHLGTTLTKLQNFEEAEKYLARALHGFKAHYKEDSTEIAWIYFEMGRLFFDKKSYEDAEKYTNLALAIYKKQNYPKIVESLELIGDIYLDKSKIDIPQNDFIKKSRDYYKEALAYHSLYYSEKSPHRDRLIYKLNQSKH